MNKSRLVAEIAERTELPPRTVAAVVDAFIEVVGRSVTRGEKVVLSGFGTFSRQTRARRTARNISTNQPVTVTATYVPAFRPGKPFREAVARRRTPRKGRARRRSNGCAVLEPAVRPVRARAAT